MPKQPEPLIDHRLTAVAEQLEGFFDPEFYAKKYPDIITAGFEPLLHYIHYGVAEGRDPNRWFDCAWYRLHYPDVLSSGRNPLLHYLQFGARALRNPHPRFDAAWYVAQHPEAADNPLLYHLRIGEARGYATEKSTAVEEYLPSTAAIPRPPDDVAVDVIIPVYRGVAETKRCIDSVLADRERPKGRIIVIDDQSPEPALSAWLATLARAGRIEVLRNRQNLGFVASCNRGMAAAGTHDVVLLNSDTEVPSGWLARLAGHAYAEPRIATLSPFSNNATICSYPSNEGGPLPPGLDVAAMDAICQQVNAGRRIALPTTVGFCMYIRREALNEVGPFDAAAYGRGYGEENDFCRRAAEKNWRHMQACDTFVFHEGSVSFSAEKQALIETATRTLLARHPNYNELVARHVMADAVAPYRFAITAALFRRNEKPTILMVGHGEGGGVHRQMLSVMQRLADQANFLLLASTDHGAELSVPLLANHPTVIMPGERLDDLLRLLRSFAVSRVHIHHLLAMDMDVRALIHRLGVKFDVTVHDYFALCPQVNLLPAPQGAYCGLPDRLTCNACIGQRPSRGAREILSWRLEQAWQFLEADRVFCPSESVRDHLARVGYADRALVVPHEPVAAQPWTLAPPPLRGRKLRVALLGVLANHKGAHIVTAVAEAADPAALEFHLIGDFEEGFPDPVKPLIQATGRYAEADLPALLRKLRPHVVWFSSSCPETYSYTLTTAIDAGLPIVATDLGAFPERLAGRPLTWLVDARASTRQWLDVFDQVRETLRQPERIPPTPLRPPVADYYATDYLRPRTPPQALVSLRHSRRTRVVVIPERYESGLIAPCGYIRLLQPLDHLAEAARLDLVLADASSALDYAADVIVTQRQAVPSEAAADALARHAKATGAALLYDLDDDLLAVPPDHPDAAEHRPKAKRVARMLQHADKIWAASAELAGRLGVPADRVELVPNALDERIWRLAATGGRPRPGPVRLLYMGTATHEADFDLILPALLRLKAEYETRVSIEVLGVTRRVELPEGLRRVALPGLAAESYPGFVDWITAQPGWDIGLAPLVDTPFNRGKSAIKTLDYAALGLVTLASDVVPYRGSTADGPGGWLVAPTTRDWYDSLCWLLRNPELRRRLASEGHRHYAATGTLAAQAATREQAWERVLRAATAPSRAGPTQDAAPDDRRGKTRPGRASKDAAAPAGRRLARSA